VTDLSLWSFFVQCCCVLLLDGLRCQGKTDSNFEKVSVERKGKVSAHELRQGLRDGEAKAASLGGSARVAPDKALKKLVGRDTERILGYVLQLRYAEEASLERER